MALSLTEYSTTIGNIARRVIALNSHMVERQMCVIGGPDASPTVSSFTCQAAGDGQVLQHHVSAEALHSQHAAPLIRIDGHPFTTVYGNVRVDRELAAGQYDGSTLNPGGEFDPIGRQFVGVSKC